MAFEKAQCGQEQTNIFNLNLNSYSKNTKFKLNTLSLCSRTRISIHNRSYIKIPKFPNARNNWCKINKEIPCTPNRNSSPKSPGPLSTYGNFIGPGHVEQRAIIIHYRFPPVIRDRNFLGKLRPGKAINVGTGHISDYAAPTYMLHFRYICKSDWEYYLHSRVASSRRNWTTRNLVGFCGRR